ncbi:MAG: trxC [Cyanobacteria bacterium RYN_339]|nr:trxC [Cyanobacteria bacterium RYN_339]
MPTVGPIIVPCAHCGARNRIQRGRAGAHCGRCNAAIDAGPVRGAPTTSSEPIHLTDASFERDVLHSKLPVLVDVWAPWCGPCRMLAPTIEAIAGRLAGKLVVGKLNSDENPRVAGSLKIQGIPTLLLFKEGKVVARQSGVMGLEQLEGWLRGAGVS